MKDTNFNTMRPDELKQELSKLREKLFDLRSQQTTGKVEDTSQFKKIRRDIARALTAQQVKAATA
jgi:large subunit ribosomal protein L29